MEFCGSEKVLSNRCHWRGEPSCDLGARNYFLQQYSGKDWSGDQQKSTILEYSVILGSTTWLVDLKISYPTPLRGGNFGLFPHMKIARLNWDKMNTWTILTPSYPGVPLFPYFHKSHMCCATPLRSMVDDILMMRCRRRPTKTQSFYRPVRHRPALFPRAEQVEGRILHRTGSFSNSWHEAYDTVSVWVHDSVPRR